MFSNQQPRQKQDRLASAFLRLERIFMWDPCIKKCGPLLTKHIVIVNATKRGRNHVNKQSLSYNVRACFCLITQDLTNFPKISIFFLMKFS
jgi:hypothetical protein